MDLISKLSQWVRINEDNDITGEVKSKWIQIQCDYMSKYCKKYCLQGHDEESCWNIHPELHEKTLEEREDETNK